MNMHSTRKNIQKNLRTSRTWRCRLNLRKSLIHFSSSVFLTIFPSFVYSLMAFATSPSVHPSAANLRYKPTSCGCGGSPTSCWTGGGFHGASVLALGFAENIRTNAEAPVRSRELGFTINIMNTAIILLGSVLGWVLFSFSL